MVSTIKRYLLELVSVSVISLFLPAHDILFDVFSCFDIFMFMTDN